MRTPKQPERQGKDNRATEGRRRWKPVVCEAEPVCEQVEERQQEASDADRDQERPFTGVVLPDQLLVALRLPRKDAANRHVGDKGHQKNQVPALNSHDDVTNPRRRIRSPRRLRPLGVLSPIQLHSVLSRTLGTRSHDSGTLFTTTSS